MNLMGEVASDSDGSFVGDIHDHESSASVASDLHYSTVEIVFANIVEAPVETVLLSVASWKLVPSRPTLEFPFDTSHGLALVFVPNHGHENLCSCYRIRVHSFGF